MIASKYTLPQTTQARHGYLDGVPYLSPSAVRQYKSCPLCYRMRYLERLSQAIGEALIIGSAVHVGIDTAREYIVDHGAEWYAENRKHVLEHARDAAESEFNRRAHDEVDREGNPVEVAWNKWSGEDKAKDKVMNVMLALAPALIDNDAAMGIDATEQRIWGLGLPLDQDEADWYAESGLEPIFPDFGFMAILDAHYSTGWMKDTKTRGAGGERAFPSWHDQMQLALYDLPFHRAGEELKLGVDVLVMTKVPEWIPFAVEMRDDFREQVIRSVLWAAERISAGDFEPNPGPFCNYTHEGEPMISVMQR